MIRFRISGYVFRISEPVVLERVEILSLIEQFQFNFLDDNRWQFILSGLKNTIIITFFAVLLGIFLGFVIAIVRSTHDKTGKLKILNVICRVYLTVIRGTPTMVQLLIVFYVIFATIDPGKIVVAIIAFGMNSAAYVAEIVRSGIMSIDQGQFEAGRSLGLNYNTDYDQDHSSAGGQEHPAGPWKRADRTFEGDIHQWLYRTYGSDPWRRHYPKPDLQCTVPAAGSSCDLSCDRLLPYLSGRKT